MVIDSHYILPVLAIPFLLTLPFRVGKLAPKLSAPNEENTKSDDY